MRSTRRVRPWVLFLLLVAAAWPPLARAAGRGEPGPYFEAKVHLGDETADLQLLGDLDLDVDGVFDGWARVYLIGEELEKLRRLGFKVDVLSDGEHAVMQDPAPRPGPGGPAAGRTIPAAYHTYETLTSELQAVALAHPDLVRLSSIGQSVQGRELWMVKITANPDVEEDEPEVAYISSMHGDEVVGKELCIGLIHHLTDGYGTDPRVTALVDDTEIWILPSMNPDGTALGNVSAARYNANGFDLNRNFPDQFNSPSDTTAGRQVETRAVMNWNANRTINLSSNFHGGALVTNYPFDSNPQNQAVYSPASDDSLFVSLARTYASNNPPMALNNSSSSFDNGITNGADWYPINGGLQDWYYVWRGGLEVLVELSNTKWPAASQLPTFWSDNLESLLSYLERVHSGVRGVVTDAQTGAPLSATIQVLGQEFANYTDPAVGDYHRVLLPGAYTLAVWATGHSVELIDTVVPPQGAARYDVALEPLGLRLELDGACADSGSGCDGWLVPGTESDVVVTAHNLGIAATAITGELVPAGWYARVSRPTAAYPDLAPDATGPSAAPYHGVSVPADLPPGHKVGFALRFSTDQGTDESEPFFLRADDPQCVSAPSTAVPRSIKDHLTVSSALAFASVLEIAEVRVSVNIDHPYIGELRVELVSPSGTPVALHNRTGGSADDIVGTYGASLTSYEPLSRVEGEPSNGTWQLRIRDGVTTDVGTLLSWSIEVCGRPPEAAPPQMLLREMTREAGGVRLSWWPYPGLLSYRVYRSSDPSSGAAFANVTSEDPDAADAAFLDASPAPVLYWLVTGVGTQGEGPKGHFGE